MEYYLRNVWRKIKEYIKTGVLRQRKIPPGYLVGFPVLVLVLPEDHHLRNTKTVHLCNCMYELDTMFPQSWVYTYKFNLLVPMHPSSRQCMDTILSNLQFWQGVHLVYNSAHPKPQLICVILYFCLYLHLQGMWCEIVPVGLAGAHDVFHKLIITKIQQQTRHQTPRSTKH